MSESKKKPEETVKTETPKKKVHPKIAEMQEKMEEAKKTVVWKKVPVS